MRHIFRMTVLVALLAPIAVWQTPLAASQMTPIPFLSGDGSLAGLLSLMPALPLGDGQIAYANAAAQLAAVNGSSSPASDAERERWLSATRGLMLPADGIRMIRPEWRETFGFDLFQVDQAVEFAAPPFVVSIMRGRFDEGKLKQAWDRQGYQSVDSDGTTYYALADDFEIDIESDAGRLALGHMNYVALLDGEILVTSSARDGIEEVLGARAGQMPSMVDDVAVGPFARSMPADLVSALIVPGARLIGGFDPIAGFLSGTPGVPDVDAIATEAAAAEAEARRMPQIVTALLGMTAGGPLEAQSGSTPVAMTAEVLSARHAMAVTNVSEAAAETAAEVIADRLETQPLPDSVPTEGTYADLFPERVVQAVPGEPVALAELVPAPDVPKSILITLYFTRSLTLLAWSP